MSVVYMTFTYQRMVVRWDSMRERVYATTFSFPKNAAYEFTVLGVIVFDDRHIPPTDPNPDRMTLVFVALYGHYDQYPVPEFACVVVNTNNLESSPAAGFGHIYSSKYTPNELPEDQLRRWFTRHSEENLNTMLVDIMNSILCMYMFRNEACMWDMNATWEDRTTLLAFSPRFLFHTANELENNWRHTRKQMVQDPNLNVQPTALLAPRNSVTESNFNHEEMSPEEEAPLLRHIFGDKDIENPNRRGSLDQFPDTGSSAGADTYTYQSESSQLDASHRTLSGWDLNKHRNSYPGEEPVTPMSHRESLSALDFRPFANGADANRSMDPDGHRGSSSKDLKRTRMQHTSTFEHQTKPQFPGAKYSVKPTGINEPAYTMNQEDEEKQPRKKRIAMDKPIIDLQSRPIKMDGDVVVLRKEPRRRNPINKLPWNLPAAIW